VSHRNHVFKNVKAKRWICIRNSRLLGLFVWPSRFLLHGLMGNKCVGMCCSSTRKLSMWCWFLCIILFSWVDWDWEIWCDSPVVHIMFVRCSFPLFSTSLEFDIQCVDYCILFIVDMYLSRLLAVAHWSLRVSSNPIMCWGITCTWFNVSG
jgi:hypothetical protein